MATDPRYERAAAGNGGASRRPYLGGPGGGPGSPGLASAKPGVADADRGAVDHGPARVHHHHARCWGLAGGLVWQRGNAVAHLAVRAVRRRGHVGVAAVASLRARDGVAGRSTPPGAASGSAGGSTSCWSPPTWRPRWRSGAPSPSFAIWFVVLALVTFFGPRSARWRRTCALFITLGTLTAGAALTAAGI